MDLNTIILAPPVKGRWVVYNPPGHPSAALDLLAEDERGSLYNRGSFLRHLVSFIPVEDTYTWASPVYSPVDGVVTARHDTADDRMKISFVYDLLSLMINKPKESDGFAAFGGNHVLIQSGDIFVLLCHLKKESVSVHKGDGVKAGQALGKVGNSGSSIQPHLHIQVMQNNRFFPLFQNLLSFTINSGKVKQDGKWLLQKNIAPRNKAHYFFE